MLFRKLDDGPIFTTENFAPEATPNKPELYTLLPIERPFDPLLPHLNGGVSGWDLVRDKLVLNDYMFPILRACGDLAVRQAISWHDQGCLIWACQKWGLEHRAQADTRWNLSVKNSRVAGRRYTWGPQVIEQVSLEEPDAFILHWNGNPNPWLPLS